MLWNHPRWARRLGWKSGLCIAFVAVLLTSRAKAADRVVASVGGGNVTIDAPATTDVSVTFSSAEPISGVGLTANFTGLFVDNINGLWPWSSEVAATVTSPDGQTTNWGHSGDVPIAGDISFVDFPFADVQSEFNNANGTGDYTFSFFDRGNTPGISELQDVTYYLLADAPDVVQNLTSNVSDGPLWNRPFFIDGISGLGPVFFDVLPFQVDVSGGYTFDSQVDNGDGFTFLYRDAFDPADPLANLLDYGLGNGNAQNDAADGQSLIEALLLEGTEYFFVTSQWASFSGPQSYSTTVTGPGGFIVIPEPSTLALLLCGVVGLFVARRAKTA